MKLTRSWSKQSGEGARQRPVVHWATTAVVNAARIAAGVILALTVRFIDIILSPLVPNCTLDDASTRATLPVARIVVLHSADRPRLRWSPNASPLAPKQWTAWSLTRFAKTHKFCPPRRRTYHVTRLNPSERSCETKPIADANRLVSAARVSTDGVYVKIGTLGTNSTHRPVAGR